MQQGLAWALITLALIVEAAPPVNDTCTGAEIIPATGPFPRLTAITDLKDATNDNDPAAPSCILGSVSRGVWYRFAPSSTALYTISCSADTATSVSDTVMAIYTSAGGCGGPLSEVDCSDDAGDLQSGISRTLTGGVTYYILVWVSGAAAPLGNNTLVQLRVSQPTAPPNDTCAGAEIIPANGPFPYLTATNDTTLATTSGDPPTPSCGAQRPRSVWFSFKPDTTANYELTLCTNTATTIYETLLAVYVANSPCTAFAQIACNHTTSCGNKLRSMITTPLTNDVTYYIVGWEGVNEPYIPGETSLQLRVTRFLPPTVTTLGASGLTSTGAVLAARVTPNAALTHAWFQYGPTTNYGSATVPANLGAGTDTINFQSAVAGLAPGIQHHFRVVATNNLGTGYGTNLGFAWSSNRPHLAGYSTSTGFALQFPGQAGQIYAVETSTNLYDWINLGLPLHLGGGLFEYRNPADEPRRFYRVLAP